PLGGQTAHAPLARTSSCTWSVRWRTAATTAELSRVKNAHVRDFTLWSQNSWNARPYAGALSWRHIDCFAIRSTVAIRGPLASIRRTVSIAMRCWLCLDVRNSTSLFARTANSRDATRATAVFPIPVGAWARRWRPSSIALRASARKSAWPSRTRAKGHGIRTAVGRTGTGATSASKTNLHRGDDISGRDGMKDFRRERAEVLRWLSRRDNHETALKAARGASSPVRRKCFVCGFRSAKPVCPRCHTILRPEQAVCATCGKAFEGWIAACDTCGAPMKLANATLADREAVRSLASSPGMSDEREE